MSAIRYRKLQLAVIKLHVLSTERVLILAFPGCLGEAVSI